MADETTYASRRERRLAQRKARISRKAASAGRGSAVALSAFGLVLTSGVAANASAGGPVQDRQSTSHQVTTPEFNSQQSSHNSAEVQAPQQSAPSADLQFEGGITTASSTGSAQSGGNAQSGGGDQSGDNATPASNVQPASSTVNAQPASNVQPDDGGNQSTNNGASNGSVLEVAQSVEGTPYSWGGTAPSTGFDCSGFINWVYDQAGAGDLPRTTHGMEAALPKVENPQPGDIVLANNSSHAAIYVGGGQVISATTTNGVDVHDMHADWHQVNAIVSPT